MGQFFSNIQFCKNEKTTAEKLLEYYHAAFLQKGYQKTENEDDADLTLAVYEQSGKWISVASDIIEFNTEDSMVETCKSLSEQFDTDVMAICCIDSDGILLSYDNCNKGIEAWAKAGYCPGISKRSRPASWKGIVTDYQKFKSVLSNHDFFAEEILEGIEPLLGLLPAQGAFRYDLCEEYPGTKLVYYKKPESKEKENPSLVVDVYKLGPCKMNSNQNVASAKNRGGSSKGLAIAFSGPYVEKEEIRLKDVQLEYYYGIHPWKIIPLELTKKIDQELGWIYYAEIPSFKIPKKVDVSLPDMKYMDEEHKRSFGVRFTPEGDEKMAGDICVHFIPLKYRKGACWWCGTKENMQNNLRQYINYMNREALRGQKKK